MTSTACHLLCKQCRQQQMGTHVGTNLTPMLPQQPEHSSLKKQNYLNVSNLLYQWIRVILGCKSNLIPNSMAFLPMLICFV